jgi:ubiquitin-conjugating enzyme E2 variant
MRAQVNMACVDQRDGRIDPGKFATLSHWRREYTLETVLTELRRDMVSEGHRGAVGHAGHGE